LNFKYYLIISVLLIAGCGLKGSPRAPLESFIPPLEKSYADQMDTNSEKTETNTDEVSEPAP
jgi:predicted small lipoprotein YifL